ncbi:MAG: hypothetical protein H8E31_11320, partial [Planctomycetes bacterium]|nr:hypothetical protein [Planctomycetota bacterium]
AYNADGARICGRLSWQGPRELVDRFWRYEAGAWVLRGADARSATSADRLVHAESRAAIAWSPTTGPAALPNFPLYGCMLACHDGGTQMPDWTEDGASDPQTMRLPGTPYYAGGGFDLWHWRAQTSGAHGYWSDELLDATQPGSGDAMRADPGAGGPAENPLAAGNPSYVFDPATTAGGGWATTLAQMEQGFDYSFEDPAAPSAVSGGGTAKALPWADAVSGGYLPSEGDVVPYWLLSERSGGRQHLLSMLSADGGATAPLRSGYDEAEGRWHLYFSRSLNTGAPGSDVQFTVDGQFVACFALHDDRTRRRDHFVSLPYRMWIEDPGSPFGAFGSDATVRQILGAGTLPDFSDTGFYPVLEVELFLPGVLSWEYLTDTRDAAFLFGQRHGGADTLQQALNGPGAAACRDCHVVDRDDPNAAFSPGGALELRTPRRGGLFEATPISLRDNLQPLLDARCAGCHEAGGIAGFMPLTGVESSVVRRELTKSDRVEWDDPVASRLLKVPAENLDGNHPPAGGLSGFAGSPDQRKLLAWLLYDAPDN